MKRKCRRRYVQAEGGGDLLADLLTLPILGAPRLVSWLANITVEESERLALDEGSVRAQLLELQQRYEAGELEEEEYDREEKALLEQLNAIREAKKERSQQG